MNSLVSIPNWSKDTGVLYLLDVIVRGTFFHEDGLQVIYENLWDIYQVLLTRQLLRLELEPTKCLILDHNTTRISFTNQQVQVGVKRCQIWIQFDSELIGPISMAGIYFSRGRAPSEGSYYFFLDGTFERTLGAKRENQRG